jgi:hypothetical protein
MATHRNEENDMQDFTFRGNSAGKHEVIEVDADKMELGILRVLRTVATFDCWHEAMICTKALKAAADAPTE